MSLENHQMYTNFHIKLLIKSACFPWSQLRTEIHKTLCSSSFFSPLALLLCPLPRCLLELSLESDLYYLSLTLSPRLCLFLSLNGDLDKRVWAAREWSLHTKRQTKRRREARVEQAARARFTEPFAPCFKLILQLQSFSPLLEKCDYCLFVCLLLTTTQKPPWILGKKKKKRCSEGKGRT